MAVHKIKTNFAAGELSPKMFGRPDFQKYDGGAAKLENFIVHRIGSISNRPGTLYIDKTIIVNNNPRSRLIPFKYNVDQVYIVEIIPISGWVKVYYGDVECWRGQYEAHFDWYSSDDLPEIKYCQSADVLFLFHPNVSPYMIIRKNLYDFEIKKAEFLGPFKDEYVAEDTENLVYIKLCNKTDAGHPALFVRYDSPLIDDALDYIGREVKLTRRLEGEYHRCNPKTDPEYKRMVNVVPGGTVHVESFGFWDGSWSLQRFNKDTQTWEDVRTQYGNRANNATFNYENKTTEIEKYRLYSEDFNNAHKSGEVDGQIGCVVIQSFGGEYSCVVKTTTHMTKSSDGLSYYAECSFLKDPAEELKIYELTEILYTRFSLGSWYGGANSQANIHNHFPTCGQFFEDRLCVAGTDEEPQTVWMSRTGDYFNFDNVKSEDDEAVTATLSGGEMNGIKAIVPFNDLVLLTSGGEYKVTGNGKAITPTNITAQAQEYCGVNKINPVVIGNRIIFAQQQGSVVRDLAYAYDVDRYTGIELGLLAEHLLRGHKVVAMAYQQIPDSIIWIVREDGVLLGITYVKEQDIYAWHEHKTDGEFIDVCVIPGDKYDQVWFVVKRDGVYQIERMPNREMYDTPAEQVFLDAAYVYGFGHSEDPEWEKINSVIIPRFAGKTVHILADGNVLPEQVVAEDGFIDLGAEYKTVIIGLGYTSTLLSMPIDLEAGDGTYLARKMRVAQLSLFFERTRGGYFGMDMEDDDGVVHSGMDELKWRSNERYGTAVELFTGKKKLSVPKATWGKTVQVRVEQRDPLPMSILALIPEVMPGG